MRLPVSGFKAVSRLVRFASIPSIHPPTHTTHPIALTLSSTHAHIEQPCALLTSTIHMALSTGIERHKPAVPSDDQVKLNHPLIQEHLNTWICN